MKNRLEKLVWEFLPSNKDSGQGVLSVYLTGSSVRGDYNPRVSDQDLLIVFDNNVARRDQKIIVEELTEYAGEKNNEFKRLDVLYINEKEVPYSEKQILNCPFSKFSVFGFDLKEHHFLLYGNDILKNFKPIDPVPHIEYFLNTFIKKAKNATALQEELIFSRQIIRCLFIKNGVKTLHKEKLKEKIGDLPYSNTVKGFLISHPYLSYTPTTPEEFRPRLVSFLGEIKSLLNEKG